MRKKIIFIFLGFLFLFLLPQNVTAQIYNGSGTVCTDIGSQSSCPTGYTCKSSGVPGGGTGSCQQNTTTSYGGLGDPCQPSGGCDGSLICSSGNICVNPKGIDTAFIKTSASSDIRCESNGINTAIGCIPVLGNDSGTAFMAFILGWAVGIGGGIAFLLILYAGFMLMTSTGNPERIKAGQELLTSAISGLILLIFSVFILKFIGVDILGLGAFGFGK
jgi:hypothetical protein